MAKYELDLDDDQAESLIKVLEYAAEPGDLSGFSSDLALSAAASLRGQIPIPVPVKIGAVVRTTEPNYTYVRWALDDTSEICWADAQDGEMRSTKRLGRITEVLSPGVDL